ncbi:MAG TPA: type I-D CRISPR-associated helicase Cas3' [Ktedonobacteraceae bacterium]|nr:type I-D CRISPR-associated helicase Cas3' [Ktedonobacteraceae bacterium]
MNDLPLCILPVYSAYDSHAQIGSIRLLRHQIETWEAFRDPAVDVIFNTAMTGDGKSLAAYLPAFQEQQNVIAMYPTNELVQDQFMALDRYGRDLSLRLPRYDTMYSERISQLVREHDAQKRLEEVRKLLERNGILLTNPDLVHLMLSHQYGWDHQRKELAVTTGSSFDYFLFDEFHVFGVPQVISVMNMLGYLLANYREKPAERKKFVFLSATPHNLLTGMLDRGGIRYKVIQGSYTSSAREQYRCILQPCNLHLHEVNQDTPTETWIKEHVEDIRHFFEENKHTGAKAAILVYSVATARRLVAFLREYFQPYGLEVGENTGLASREERQESYHKHILVGTSTVDIGVDFHINYLIFEASNAGSFLQRFGRLGRHEGFARYEAHALLPRFVLERLAKKYEAGQEIERELFNEGIREAFPGEQEFEGYTRRWGVVQAAQVLAEMQSQEKRDANTAFAQAVQEQYERFYGDANKPAMPKALKKYWALKTPGHAPEIIDELNSFRGQSPLSCSIWDTDDRLKTYDLFFLLTNTSFEVLRQEAFMQEVNKRGLDEREFRNKHFYLRVWDYVEERQSLVLGLRHNLSENEHILHQVVVLDDLFVREPRVPWLDKINRDLKRLRLPCLLSPLSRDELKGQYRLGGIFPIYRLRDGWGHEYSVAFGEEALLLDSLLFFRKTKDERAMML